MMPEREADSIVIVLCHHCADMDTIACSGEFNLMAPLTERTSSCAT